MQPTVFLDRDGTLIVDRNFLVREEEIDVFPQTIEALRILRSAGFLLIVVSNQAGVARGILSEPRVEELNRVVFSRLRALGEVPDAFYYCPHHPQADLPAYRLECACRKPDTGLARSAAQRFDIDFEHCYAVGDKLSDVGLGQNLGGKGILVLTGYGLKQRDLVGQSGHCVPDFVAENILEAARWIVADYARRLEGGAPES